MTRVHGSWLLWSVLLLSAVGCSKSGTFVVVEIQGTTTGVRELDLDLTFNGQTSSLPLHEAGGGDFTLPVSKGLSIAHGAGLLSALVIAKDAAGNELIRGIGSVTVVRDQTETLTVVLGVTTGNDGGLDDGGAGDGGGLDGSADSSVAGPAVLGLDAPSFDFGSVVTGAAPATHVFMVSNTGGMVSGVPAASLSGGGAASFSLVSTCQAALSPGGRCMITVSFAPSAAGALSATLTVTGAPGGSVTAALSGTGVLPGALTIAPASLSFGTEVVNGQTAPLTLTVTNTGGVASGAMTASLSGSDAAQFVIEAPGAGDCRSANLNMNQTCTIKVHFAPTAINASSASLSVTSVSAGTAVASLVGTGVNGLAPSGVGNHDFGTLGTGTTSAPFTFTLTNNNAQTTGPVMFALALADASQFNLVPPAAGDCVSGTTTLAMNATCTVRVRFAPTTVGAKNAQVSLTATPGGNAVLVLTGLAVTPAALAAAPASLAYPTTGTGGSSASMACTVTNGGEATSGALAISLTGTDLSQFALDPPGAGDCTGATLLTAGASCTVHVHFAPSTTGAKSAAVSVTGVPGGTVGCALTGTGAAPALLSPATTTNPFAATLVGQSSASFTWTVTNTGGVPTGVLSRTTTGNVADFTLTDPGVGPCTGALAPAASCTLQVKFTPASLGNKILTVTLTGAPGGSVVLNATGSPLASLTASKTGTGTGTLVSTPAGISCLAGCTTQTAPFAGLSSVMLEAKPLAGSYFQGWTGACSGNNRFCTVMLGMPTQTATATFAPIVNNLVFVTSEQYPANFGGLAVADGDCARLAGAAGLSGNFVAYLSTSTVNAKDRLGAARGWVRMDGKPFMDTAASLTTTHQVFYPIRFDENGNDVVATAFNDSTWTGTINGVNGGNCTDWTSSAPAGQGIFGEAGAGPKMWSFTNPSGCNGGPYRLYCFMTDKSAAVTAPTSAGKKIWVTNNSFAPNVGTGAADNACDAQKPAGVVIAKALLSTSVTPAATLVTAGTNYIRPDGLLVGTGADLGAGGSNVEPLQTGIWQNGDGTYDVGAIGAWSGGNGYGSFAQNGTYTCNDWTSLLVGFRGSYGIFGRASNQFWGFGSYTCDQGLTFRFYCVER